MMVHPDSHRVSRAPWYSGDLRESHRTFRVLGYHLLWRAFPGTSARWVVCNSPARLQSDHVGSRNPGVATLAGLTPNRFGLIRVRSPLLTESLLLSLPQGTEMVHFPWLASTSLCVQLGIARHDPCWVSPFGHLRLFGCTRLTGAFRSVPRPSSALNAKASTVCPYLLLLCSHFVMEPCDTEKKKLFF